MDPTQWNAPFLLIVAALFVIVFLRANATYWVGRAILAGGRRTRAGRFFDSPGYHRAERWLSKWGTWAVALSFLTIGVQTMVNIAAGVGKMSLRRYLPSMIVGCVMWAFLYATVGFVSVAAIGRLWSFSPGLAIGAGSVLALALVALTAARRRPLVETAKGTNL